ncbi:hypothetical protein OG550_28990 [Kitasatospora sp. NBC_00458]
MRAARENHEWPGWVLAAVGTVLCVLGWYGVSGESFAEQQIPYLASATIPGAALIVAGVVLVALRSPGRFGPLPPPPPPGAGAGPTETDRRVEQLHALLVEPAPAGRAEGAEGAEAGDGGEDDPGPLLAVPAGTLYHRPDCVLLADRPAVTPVDAAAVRDRGLAPCGLCDPPAPPGAGPDGPGTPGAPGRPDAPAPPTV